jgi:stage II sporulation protein AA (anti-sigma F factor antagonist)
MKVSHKLVGSCLYISLSGELDESAADETRERIESLFGSVEMTRAVIDLSETAFMDSTGIGVLIGRYKRLQSRGIPASIANPTAAVDKILTLSGIYRLMPRIIH